MKINKTMSIINITFFFFHIKNIYKRLITENITKYQTYMMLRNI